MQQVKMFPPNGGKDYIMVHPSKVDEMKDKGWLLEPKKIKEVK